MYRVLGLRGTPLRSAALQAGAHPSPRAACLLCSGTSDHLLISHQLAKHSSTINTVTLGSVDRKKIRKKAKKYAELLEVTDSATNNRKAAIQRLNAAQLSILVDQPDITLDKLHKLGGKQLTKKNKSYSTTRTNISISDKASSTSCTNLLNFSDTFSHVKGLHKVTRDVEDSEESIAEELESSGITDPTELIKTSSLVSCIDNESAEKIMNTTDDRLDESQVPDHPAELEEKIADTEHKAREAIIYEEKLKQFNTVLLGYVDVCVNSGSLNYGNNVIHSFDKRRKTKKQPLYVNNISVYNMYIEKLASNADFMSISKILQKLRKDKISLNAQTYAYIFYCIGRMDGDSTYKLELLRNIQGEMDNDGVVLNDILTKSLFVLDQRKQVQKMIKLIDDQFEPTYEMPDPSYDCRLLQQLKEEDAIPSSPVEGLFSHADFKYRLEKQIGMEIDGQVIVQNIAKQNTSSSTVKHFRNKLSSIEKKWEAVALQAFKRDLVTLKSREKLTCRTKMMLHPYLTILEPEDYSRVILREVRNLGMGSDMYTLPFTLLCRQLGLQVFKMYEARMKQKKGVNDKMSEIYLQYCNWLLNRNDKFNNRTKWMFLEHEANKYGVNLGLQVPEWQSHVHLIIGKFLFNIILNDLKFNTHIGKKKNHQEGHGYLVPAFFKIFRHSGYMLRNEIKPHPLIVKLYKESQPETLTFDTTLVPSVCPPRPWVSIRDGGYVVTRTDVVRVNSMGNQQWDRLKTTPQKKLYPALDSLNQLGSIPWTINSSVLDVAIKVFQNNGSVQLNVPQPPSVLQPIPPLAKNATPEEKKQVERARMEQRRKQGEMHSLWCDALYRLSLANHFRNETFWLPHNMDFRGRVYPVPPHLNHLGSDLARSILIFALKKPLGSNGLNWLKLHCINLTGFMKKEPIRERLKYANEIMDDILDSANNPLKGKMWWAKSDEPWQTLATCMEIAAALKSSNPEEFLSGFPIHQDGSCNGLQHYAALGRDQIGAVSVNLYPSDYPQDVYSSVASMVDDRRKEDAAKGNQTAQILEGFVKRKVIKQTVMTTVYGVTWFGAKMQIARQLKDLDDFPQEHLLPASTYLVTKTFESLRSMFKSAREIQDWFTECARQICITREQNMEWVTPLGLPVVQPYSKAIRCEASKQNVTTLFTSDIYRRPNVMKQKNAFAPNYVHSLDSSHMMLTSIHTEHKGITFVSVHDCYWTHPCTVEIMNKICREQFVALHSEPILEDLSKFLIDKFAYKDSEICSDNTSKRKRNQNNNLMKKKLNSTLSHVPEQGDFDLNGVLSSTYFFS